MKIDVVATAFERFNARDFAGNLELYHPEVEPVRPNGAKRDGPLTLGPSALRRAHCPYWLSRLSQSAGTRPRGPGTGWSSG
jgi:hypothetical protein